MLSGEGNSDNINYDEKIITQKRTHGNIMTVSLFIYLFIK